LFAPLYAQGRPGLASGVPYGDAGLVTRADGSQQRTWNGEPLYLYGDEGLSITPAGLVANGNGNGVSAPAPASGTFSLVTP
jgi:predicted lipoprotein with Yx(FWY)xxD motif